MQERWKVWLLLLPALLVVLLLFGGGLLLGLVQSLGYLPVIGRTTLSLAAYRALFTQPAFVSSLLLTLWIALVSTAAGSALGIAAALLLRRPTRRGSWLLFLFQLNIPIPHIVGAIGIMLLVGQSGLLARLAYLAGVIDQPGQFPALLYDRYAIGIILEYVWKATCFIGIIVLAALQALGDEYEAAAATLGANRWQRLRHVVLPLIAPSALSAALLVFAFTFGAFEIPFLLGRPFPAALPVLAYRRYTNIDLNARIEAMAINMVIAAISTLIIFIYLRIARRAASRQESAA